MKDYVRHIKDNRTYGEEKFYCGEPIEIFDTYFTNIEHALGNDLRGGRLLPCSKCIEKIKELLNNIESDSK